MSVRIKNGPNRSRGAKLREWTERSIAAIILVVISPLLLVIAASVALTIGRPILFSQERAGRGGRPFKLVKFRTMHELRNLNGRLLPDSHRLTAFGRWLRRTSIDELPELVNIARGEMAFVGPRPLPMVYVDRYSEIERSRLDVLPGLTGWAQVNGRNAIDWDDRLALDVWYVAHRSLLLDLKILLVTIRVVLLREGINAEDSATMNELRPPIDGVNRDGKVGD